MACELEYHLAMGRLSATVAVFAVFLFWTLGATAQINGVPASVTSMGFGGHFNPGVPASVTSLGPHGFRGQSPFITQPQCCINPLFPRNPNGRGFHHHRGQAFFPGAVAVYPYAPVEMAPGYDGGSAGQQDEEDDRGGPTIFDRRGSGQYERDRYADRDRRVSDSDNDQPQPVSASSTPIAEPAPTVLVFKDGHTVEVRNYAILGSLVYDLTPGHPRKIPLSDLDLEATAKQNDDRGIDFRLPAGQVN